MEDGNLYLRLRTMSHTIYAAKFQQTIIHQHIHLRQETQSHAPTHLLMRLCPIDKSLVCFKVKEGRHVIIFCFHFFFVWMWRMSHLLYIHVKQLTAALIELSLRKARKQQYIPHFHFHEVNNSFSFAAFVTLSLKRHYFLYSIVVKFCDKYDYLVQML